MLVDTDVLICFFRGDAKAVQAIDQIDNRRISVVNYMELLQGARDKSEVRSIRSFLADMNFETFPLTERIGHRAVVYMEAYRLKMSLCMGDALIAATAVEHTIALLTGNHKHFKVIPELELVRFLPSEKR